MNSTEKEFYDSMNSLTGLEGPFIVAFSGGCDSTALLVLCHNVLPDCKFYPVYLNHNLRSIAELESEIELNCFNCDNLDMYLEIETLHRGEIESFAEENKCGIEAAARSIRYEILEKKRQEHRCTYILTAHHLDDQLETIAMKLYTNAPQTSLRGIAEKKGFIVRPLLSLRHDSLKDYLISRGISWSTDSTNNDTHFLRNYIRNVYLPQKRKEEKDYDSFLLEKRSEAVLLCNNTALNLEKNIKISSFLDQPDAGRILMLFDLWDRCLDSYRFLPSTLIKRVTESCEKGQNIVIEASGGRFEICNGMLYLTDPYSDSIYDNFSVSFDAKEGIDIVIPGELRILSLSKANIKQKEKTDLCMSPECFDGVPVVRFAHENDSIKLKCGKKTVIKMLKDMKVPCTLRKRVPVISDNSGICAVFGSVYGGNDRIASRFRSCLAEMSDYRYIVVSN